jgi:hypothetical protein
MKTTWLDVVAVSTALLLAQVTLVGHHAFSAEFDATKAITLSGTVAQVRWTNPHAHIHVDVKDPDGKVTSWDFELGSPNALMRRGWSRTTLKAGDMITVTGYPAKDGSRLANARSATLSDGRTVFAGSSIETQSPQ